jgi:hypothetical protein
VRTMNAEKMREVSTETTSRLLAHPELLATLDEPPRTDQ